MDLEEALRHALDGQALLFVGAGFSADAKNKDDVKLPTGEQLEVTLAAEISISPAPALDVVSDMYKERKGEFALTNLIRERFNVATIAEAQAVFGTVPWRRVYTTNYDNVVEVAYEQAKGTITPITIGDAPTNIAGETRLCVHINGYVKEVTGGSLPPNFLLTNTSYLSDTASIPA